MPNEKGHLGLLYIFDCIAVVAGSCLALAISKFVFHAEVRTDLMVIILFMVAIRLLVMAFGDFTGFSQKIWRTVLLVFIAEVCVVAVEYVMVFGLSQRLMIMTAGIDLVLVLMAHLIWSRRMKTVRVQSQHDHAAHEEAPSDQEDQPEDQNDQKDEKVSWLLRGSVLEDEDDQPEAPLEEEADSGTAQDWLEDEADDMPEDDQEDLEDLEAESLFTREANSEAAAEEEIPEMADSADADLEDFEETEPKIEAKPQTTPDEIAEEQAPEFEPQEPEIQQPSEEVEEDEETEEDAAQNVEVALNHFIDILSTDAEDRAYREASDDLSEALIGFSKYRFEEPFATTSRTLVAQLEKINSQQDVTADMIDNVIKIAQQVESIEQVEKVVEAPNATVEKPIEARRVKKSDYHIQDGEVLLDSGDSEIIISKEDLELIRSYMKAHKNH
jgi:hypothetical protein